MLALTQYQPDVGSHGEGQALPGVHLDGEERDGAGLGHSHEEEHAVGQPAQRQPRHRAAEARAVARGRAPARPKLTGYGAPREHRDGQVHGQKDGKLQQV